jgi:hypothetical protein
LSLNSPGTVSHQSLKFLCIVRIEGTTYLLKVEASKT